METKPRTLSFDNTEIAFAHKSNRELKKGHFLYKIINSNIAVKLGTRLTPLAFKLHLPIKGIVKATIFAQFCGGETLSECAVTIDKLAKYNVDTILDYGVEGKESDHDFDLTVDEYQKVIGFIKGNKHVPFISLKVTGLARFALLEKLNRDEKLTEEETVEWNRVKGRMHRICKTAHDAGVSVMIDAEETWIQNPVDWLAEDMSKFYNKERATVLNTVQLYRHDRLAFLKLSLENAKKDNYVLGIKLVRGAYMEKERSRAVKLNHPSPIQPDKASCDRDYNLAVEYCIEHINDISFCVASHNEYSNMYAAQLMDNKNLPHDHPHLHFSQLLGMSDNITFNLANMGYRVSKYVPYGPVKDVVPYLIRRAQENTSIGGQTSRELSLIKKELKRRSLI